MKNNNTKEQQLMEFLLYRINDYRAAQQIRQRNMVVRNSIILVCAAIIIYGISSMFKLSLIEGFTILALILVIFIVITGFPIFGILTIVTWRTKHYVFAIQLLSVLFLICYLLNYSFHYLIVGDRDPLGPIASTFLMLIMFLLLLCGFLSAAFLLSTARGEKSLFLGNTLASYGSTILTQQTLQTADVQDGYTPRPFFAAFPEIQSYCPTVAGFKSMMKSYIRFLAREGEIIGWKTTETAAVIYPRVLMDTTIGILPLYRLLARVYKKKGLTAVIIDYSSKELSLRITREDYDALGEVTYHLLSKQILERFRQSIIAFFQNDLATSYFTLFPRVLKKQFIWKGDRFAPHIALVDGRLLQDNRSKFLVTTLIQVGLGFSAIGYVSALILTVILVSISSQWSFQLFGALISFFIGIPFLVAVIIMGLLLIGDGITRISKNLDRGEKRSRAVDNNTRSIDPTIFIKADNLEKGVSKIPVLIVILLGLSPFIFLGTLIASIIIGTIYQRFLTEQAFRLESFKTMLFYLSILVMMLGTGIGIRYFGFNINLYGGKTGRRRSIRLGNSNAPYYRYKWYYLAIFIPIVIICFTVLLLTYGMDIIEEIILKYL